MMEMLDLSGCKTNQEVSNLIRDRVKEVSLEDLTASLSESFVFQKDTIRKMYAAAAMGKNILLYGHGGFSKSTITKAFFKELGIPVHTKVGYKDMNPEELLGIPNMKKLLEESKYETAFEHSIFSKPGVLILEEFGDVAESTVASLKDILTDRGFREGDTKKESMISTVIMTSNRTPDELVVSDTTQALYKERFPYRHNTVWDNFSESAYTKYIQVVHPDIWDAKPAECRLISKLCMKTEGITSPRITSDAVECMHDLGVEMLDTIEDLDTTLLSEHRERLELDRRLFKESKILTKVDEFIKGIHVEPSDCKEALSEAQIKLVSAEMQLAEVQTCDENFNELRRLKGLIREHRETIEEYFTHQAYEKYNNP